MKVIHVVPAISEEASGPSYSVVRLCESLIAQGEEVTLAALDWAPMKSPPPFLKAFPLGWGPRRLGRSPAMRRWLAEQAATDEAAVFHNHGMWQMNAVYPAWAAGRGSIDLVISPRGALSEWAMRHGSRMKNVFWPFLQRPALARAACFHATADSEYEDIRRLGFRQPAAIIPNGIDVPAVQPRAEKEIRTLLFLGRIHRKKGLDILLPAWKAVQERFPEWRLVIAGSDVGYRGEGGYSGTLRKAAAELGLLRIDFVGELVGPAKWRAYRDADLFVLPTYSENFAMTVAEALAAGTPALVSKGAPWPGLAAQRAGWWVDIGLDPLVAGLSEALARPPAELAAMGERGRDWMINDFSWPAIGKQMADTYRWLRDQSRPAPAWVRLG